MKDERGTIEDTFRQFKNRHALYAIRYMTFLTNSKKIDLTP
ncbi:hypothetical protein ACFL5Z_15210 [Planctomycetota bacterium]